MQGQELKKIILVSPALGFGLSTLLWFFFTPAYAIEGHFIFLGSLFCALSLLCTSKILGYMLGLGGKPTQTMFWIGGKLIIFICLLYLLKNVNTLQLLYFLSGLALFIPLSIIYSLKDYRHKRILSS